MRRANAYGCSSYDRFRETSLHAQSKLNSLVYFCILFRNISACAEQTASLQNLIDQYKKHLCMRSANVMNRIKKIHGPETSLHAQSKHYEDIESLQNVGNISACAEQTLTALFLAFSGKETSLHAQSKQERVLWSMA